MAETHKIYFQPQTASTARINQGLQRAGLKNNNPHKGTETNLHGYNNYKAYELKNNNPHKGTETYF